ncbi:MAG TPA: hypothetical protein VL359_06495 [bacterium]|nr:hypothetical protein [bacterium]
MPIARTLLAAALLVAGGTWASAIRAAAPEAPGSAAPASDAALAQVGWINQLYAEGDDFRAESQVLSFLFQYPSHPLRPQVELARAKLYYREGRYAEAHLMLLSLLDRYPLNPAREDALRLLAFCRIRQGQLREAAPLWALLEGPPLTPLELPVDTPDPARAVAWSTWLPGSGFLVLGEPAKAFTALGLTVLLAAGAVLSYQQSNPPAALVFLLADLALYSGGRQAVRDEAERLAAQARQQQRVAWLPSAGEPALLQQAVPLVGWQLRF